MTRDDAPGHVLVVGATGVLRPAAAELARRGHRVSALARRPGPLARLAREWGGAGGAARARARGRGRPGAGGAAAAPPPRPGPPAPGLPELLAAARHAAGPFTGALLYCPDAPAEAVAGLLRAVGTGGPAVLLLTSAWAAPGAGQPPFPAARRLLLGWAAGPGGPRWHTPAEISAGALARFEGPPGDGLLGVVRPWAERPA
ncbi:hypothetical protein ACFV4M_27085 [Kitasatospora indigofera]|uniref:hypothetical protein n=1 Tax=Kitasatospora indigofera TaxID=67307 RepID=UPI00365E2D09